MLRDAILGGKSASATVPASDIGALRLTTDVAWETAPGLTEYAGAVRRMEAIAEAIRADQEPERIWLVEHPPLYTAGTSARPTDLLLPDRFPVFATGRGGQYTYHGPGQRVVYVMLDLNRRRPDVRAFVRSLESWIIATLAEFGVRGECRADRIGVWVARPDLPKLPDGSMREDKIAAIGIRLRKWVSFHGFAVNVAPELEHFSGIVPCGVSGHGVTSLADLGVDCSLVEFDAALLETFRPIFGPLA
jgi:lipoyl(octanoyl) transferase